MFAWIHHLVDEGYFRSIELFFLFAGHTHSPLDQNFSVVGKAITKAHFIGSIIAMQELFKAAHDITKEKSMETRITETYYLEVYHDYVQKYDPVIDSLIHNYGGPHRYLTEMNDRWGISDCRYMWQSPEAGFVNTWLSLRPTLLEDAVDLSADIGLQPLVSLGGQERVLEKLKVNATQNFGELLSAKASRKSAGNDINKVKAFNDNLPSIERLEAESLVAQDVIYISEMASGRSDKKNEKQNVQQANKKLRKQMLGEVEAMMLSENTRKAGYLRFLKRSLVEDIAWLDKRPDILPNPKMWREQTKRGALSPALTVPALTVPAVLLVDGTHEIHLPTSSTLSKSNKAKNKEKKDPVYELAVTRLLQFNSAAAQMAKTARFMLELHRAGDRFGFSESFDICKATRSFREVLLTRRDIIFYENIETVALITRAQEQLVAEEEARVWQLLRLPATMPEVDVRRAKVRKEQEEIFAKKQSSLTKLLSKVQDGFDITREVISRPGKETIFSKTLEDMTIDQLKIIISKAQVTGRSKFKTKPSLIEAIKKYLADNPTESLRSLCGEDDDEEDFTQVAAPEVNSASSISDVGTTAASIPVSNTSIITPAPILEIPTTTAGLLENIGIAHVDNQGCDNNEISSAIAVPQDNNDILRVSANAAAPL